ncbi:hypothetical protein NQ317_019690 [Molorchus minor]|uniref:RING-type domain-containing protein n=1 Tax=Molorchus minor TaxID=1323400 RepID=A0ABQ9J0S6_9CUCU|nr:hypothetical protein NQ317_019690 [Molorchus minor]
MDNKQLLNLVQLLIALKEKLKCPICIILDVIQNVTELSCGHRYCEECYSQHKSNEKQVSCPMCKNVVTRRSSFYKDMYADSLGNGNTTEEAKWGSVI